LSGWQELLLLAAQSKSLGLKPSFSIQPSFHANPPPNPEYLAMARIAIANHAFISPNGFGNSLCSPIPCVKVKSKWN
jgi:hypothetical protein